MMESPRGAAGRSDLDSFGAADNFQGTHGRSPEFSCSCACRRSQKRIFISFFYLLSEVGSSCDQTEAEKAQVPRIQPR